jgi:site-specific recombinase XerD
MYQRLFKQPRFIEQLNRAPLADEREKYLRFRERNGLSHRLLRIHASELLRVVDLINISSEGVTMEQICSAAERRLSRPYVNGNPHSWSCRIVFRSVATEFCRFLGFLREDKKPEVFEDLKLDFCLWLDREREFSTITVANYSRHASWFLRWYYGNKEYSVESLVELRINDVDNFLIHCSNLGWSRSSIASVASVLRVFFRYLSNSRSCQPSIAEAIEAPKVIGKLNLPMGPDWGDVRRLVLNMDTKDGTAFRDRAIIMLCAIYGLRRSEVVALKLENLDWENNVITVWRSKQLRSQKYPLVASVGNAIIEYLANARPSTTHREIFLSRRPPFRPLSPEAVSSMVRRRMSNAGVASPHQGPHALRHSCAANLIQQGFSLKEVGDHLGHKSSTSTQIYAKVDLVALREVAKFEIGDVI